MAVHYSECVVAFRIHIKKHVISFSYDLYKEIIEY